VEWEERRPLPPAHASACTRISPEENAVVLLECTGTGLAAKLTEERNPDSARHKLQPTGGAGVQEELPASHARVWRLRFRFSTVRVKAAALLWSHLVESHTPCGLQSPNTSAQWRAADGARRETETQSARPLQQPSWAGLISSVWGKGFQPCRIGEIQLPENLTLVNFPAQGQIQGRLVEQAAH